MKNSILVFLTVTLVSIASGCFESQEFEDTPKNLDAKRKSFEEVSKLLSELKGADLARSLELMNHKDSRVRRASVNRLQVVGAGSPKARQALATALATDEAPRVRSAAARVLGALKSSEGAGALIAALCDKDGQVRVFAWKAILRLGEVAHQAILDNLSTDSAASKRHCEKSEDKRYTVRHEVRDRLGAMGTKAVPVLVAGLDHGNGSVVGACIDLLGGYGRSAAPAVPKIIELLHNSDEATRVQALTTIGKIGDVHPSVMPALYEAQSDESRNVKMAATRAIAAIQSANQRNSRRPGHTRRPEPSRRR